MEENRLRILAVADHEAKLYYDFYQPGCLDEFDLIIGCGDLRKEYLEFLATFARCPVLYVCGNHDESYDTNPPEGCLCIEDQIYVYRGIRILGLGGSFRYREGTHMYTERQMARRIRRLWFSLRRHGGFDILVTHAPARGMGDLDSLPHRGFSCFIPLLDRYRPRYFVHGHIHKNYGMNIRQRTQYQDTTVINAYEYCRFEIEPK